MAPLHEGIQWVYHTLISGNSAIQVWNGQRVRGAHGCGKFPSMPNPGGWGWLELASFGAGVWWSIVGSQHMRAWNVIQFEVSLNEEEVMNF